MKARGFSFSKNFQVLGEGAIVEFGIMEADALILRDSIVLT